MSPLRKICPLDRLLTLRCAAARSGQTLVHCHGCFDIVHPGHIQYLQFAKSQGDVLVVSLTADPNVNKGAARPLIPEDLRAASVAALECVDFVYVNPDPTAVELLDALRPDVYVKGREYETNQDPRFLAERDAVTRHGGRVIFSSGEVVYSSTALIGSFSNAQLFNEEKVRRFRQSYGLNGADLANLVHRFRGMRMIVVGDYILDRYHSCDATGVAAESPMMSLRLLKSDDFDGGAAIIAAHLAGLGCEPTLITAVTDDEAGRRAEARLTAAGVEVAATRDRRSLSTKHRYLVDATKMIKVDDATSSPLDSGQAKLLCDQILAAADGAAGVIFADFGYGLITSGLLDQLMPQLRPRVPVITADVSGMQSSLLRFRQVDLLCPTEREVRQTLNNSSSGLNAIVHQLLQVTQAKQALITMGKQGLVAFDQHRPTAAAGESWERRLRSAYLPSLAHTVIDSLGCGDALLSVASATLAAGGSLHAAAYLGSIAASIEAEQLGNVAVSIDAVVARLNETLAPAQPARLAS
ncbi:MAG: PfkB family carbohydrate kinase [Planctomycetota bacterium]|nr:PfkB family carbohydrate kinase [Planctomycetota bacterium]